jgi:hypothetical protein
MDACNACKRSDAVVAGKFTRLIHGSWTFDELRRLVETAASAMLPRTPKP